MMKKFIFANAALLALSISGAWADAVQTIDTLGVRYNVVTSDTTHTTPSVEGVITCSTDGATAGVLNLTGTEKTTKTTTINYNVTPTAFIGASVTFGSWNKSDQIVNATNPNNTSKVCIVGDTDYQTAINKAKSHGVTLYTWQQVKDNRDGNYFVGAYYDDEEGEWGMDLVNTYSTTSDYETNYNGTEYNNASDFYYFMKKQKVGSQKNQKVYYAIYKVSDASNEEKDSTTVRNYNYTTVPAFLAAPTQPTAITINADIDDIAEGAFYNCNSINNFICEDEDKFLFESPILYAADKVTEGGNIMVLYVTSNVTNTEVTLDGDVTRIADYATITITKGVYIYYNNLDLNFDESTQSAFFTWISSNGDLKMSYDSEKKSYSVLAGSPLKQETVNKAIAKCLEEDNEIYYIDFRDGIITDGFTINANQENILFLFGSTDKKIGGVNVVRNTNTGFICDSLSLEDAYSNKAFYSPVSFDVAKATYDRQFTEGFYSSVCLPFEFKSIPEGFTVGHMSSYEASTNTFVFEENKNNMSAYKPYIVVSENGNQAFPTLENVTVAKTTTITNESSNGATFIGTISPVVLTGGADSYMYYGFSNKTGKLAHVGENKSTTVKSFRAYFKAPATNYQTGSAAEIRFEYENGEVSAITSIEETQNDDNVIYNLNGQRVNDMKAAGIYVKNGKTIMVK